MRALLKRILPTSIRRNLTRAAQNLRNFRFYQHAKSQISAIKHLPQSPFKRIARPGFMRGIDFYSSTELISSIALTMEKFRSAHGLLPNLLEPKGFNEKIVWSKFFAEMKIPESGNKLLTSKFIPKH